MIDLAATIAIQPPSAAPLAVGSRVRLKPGARGASGVMLRDRGWGLVRMLTDERAGVKWPSGIYRTYHLEDLQRV